MRKWLIVVISLLSLCVFQMAYAATPKKWTFMVFLNGNNNLDNFGFENIKAMEKVGSNDEVNIVVQWASLSSRKVVRMLIQKSNNPNKVTSPIVLDLGSVDMGNYHSLKDFIAWTVKNYPADHYFIDVWNHGSGWRKARLGTNKDISWDDLTGNSISTEQLGRVMEFASQLIGHKVDIYGSDACLMGMAEVANEMSDYVQYFVGSQELEPGKGWPYDDFLGRWLSSSNPSADQVSKMLVETYIKSYEVNNMEVTFSAYDLGKLATLNKALLKLSQDIQHLSPQERDQVLNTAKTVQTFGFMEYGDLLDFTEKLKLNHIKGISVDDIAAVETTAHDVIIANGVTKEYDHAHGISVWLPLDYPLYEKRSDRYKHLEFDMSTKWSEALDSLLQGVYPE